MRALVVYESMYGNTHRIAEAIGEGLAEVYRVDVVPSLRVSAVSSARRRHSVQRTATVR
jgi:menaquinone-dependent protoporphyrinogen IX oxidase